MFALYDSDRSGIMASLAKTFYCCWLRADLELAGVILGAVALAISVVALAMAIPPFLQMIWGAPNVKLTFQDSAELHGSILLVPYPQSAGREWF